ncbi:T9SS type A sorting domain-containing protein [candidate division KSB1 bacterium]|nr:T9SS type A sorting domain-containing protein [candidate division KSB1 bacterium]
MWTKVLLPLIVLAALMVAASRAEVVVTITYPADGDVFSPCIDLDIQASAEATAGEVIDELRFYTNNLNRGRDTQPPYERTLKALAEGVYVITVRATDSEDKEYWSDPVQIRVGNVSRGEKIFNGSFSCGVLTPWTTSFNESGAATFSVYDDGYFEDNYYLFIDVLDGSSMDWHIQLNQSCPTDSGHLYEIYFMADADMDKTIAVGMQENHDPWESQTWQNVTIDGYNLYGPIAFEAYKTDPTNQLRLNFGGNTIPCFIDAVQVIDRSASGVKSKRLDFNAGPVTDFELYPAYPNPFNMDTTIPFKLNDEGYVSVDIYNIQGQKIKTLASQIYSRGDFTVNWNGLDSIGQVVPSGVYFYRVTVDMNGKSLTMSGKVLLMK